MEEVGGAVERVDVPAVGLVRPLHHAGLFHDEAVVGPRLLELIAQDLLGLAVGRGDEVAGALARDLEVLDLAEIALQRARRLEHGIGHHGHERRADHVGPLSRGQSALRAMQGRREDARP
jgi:hypothetical protein